MAKDNSILTEYDPETREWEPVGGGISAADIARITGGTTTNEATPLSVEEDEEEWAVLEVVDDDSDIDDWDEDDDDWDSDGDEDEWGDEDTEEE